MSAIAVKSQALTFRRETEEVFRNPNSTQASTPVAWECQGVERQSNIASRRTSLESGGDFQVTRRPNKMEISAFCGGDEALPAKRGVIVQAKNTREALHSHLANAQQRSQTKQ